MKRVVFTFVALLGLACAAPTTTPPIAPTSPASAPAATGITPSPFPSGGVSQSAAVAVAVEHSDMKDLVSASVTSYPGEYIGPGFVVTPGELVWVVHLTGEMTICGGPPEEVCQSPRPGFSTVYVDYFTGRFIGIESYSPAP